MSLLNFATLCNKLRRCFSGVFEVVDATIKEAKRGKGATCNSCRVIYWDKKPRFLVRWNMGIEYRPYGPYGMWNGPFADICKLQLACPNKRCKLMSLCSYCNLASLSFKRLHYQSLIAMSCPSGSTLLITRFREADGFFEIPALQLLKRPQNSPRTGRESGSLSQGWIKVQIIPPRRKGLGIDQYVEDEFLDLWSRPGAANPPHKLLQLFPSPISLSVDEFQILIAAHVRNLGWKDPAIAERLIDPFLDIELLKTVESLKCRTWNSNFDITIAVWGILSLSRSENLPIQQIQFLYAPNIIPWGVSTC